MRIRIAPFRHAQHELCGHVVCFLATTLGALRGRGDVCVIDSMPLPVGRRVRARRGRNVRGRVYGGDGAAKRAKFFGWRLPLIYTPTGIPVRLRLVSAAFHDRTPIHELARVLPRGARRLGDKASHSQADAATMLQEPGVRLIAVRRANMAPHPWFLDERELRAYRRTMETVNSQYEKRGMTRLHARTQAGFALKVCASLIAFVCTNMN